MPVNYTKVIISLIRKDPERMMILRTARSLDLKDWCIGAGFVRNCVWDHLHNYNSSTRLNDIDVCYYNSNCLDEKVDKVLEVTLENKLPGKRWSVKNQARMHRKNKCKQYENTKDATSYWPEIQTAVGVSINYNDEITIRTAYSIERLFSLMIERTSKCLSEEAFLARIKQKRWLEIWPKLKISSANDL